MAGVPAVIDLCAALVMSESNKEHEIEYAPLFNAEPWQHELHAGRNKPFIKTTLRSLWYVPIGFGKAMLRLEALLRGKNAKHPEHLNPAAQLPKRRMNLLRASAPTNPIVPIETLDELYFSRVYDGDYSNMNRWMQDFEHALKVKKLRAKQIFIWQTNCPGCAKKVGSNPAVIVAEVWN